MENTSFAKVRHAQKPKFQDSLILGFKVTQQSWLLIFAFSLALCFCFSCLIFFFFAEHLVGFILVGNVFRKALMISELDKRKVRWVMEQDFHGNFQVNVTWFFAFFSGVLDWIVLILVWFERSLHSAQVSRQSCPWPIKLMMSQAVEETWIDTGCYGQLTCRGEWVNEVGFRKSYFKELRSRKLHYLKYEQKVFFFILTYLT